MPKATANGVAVSRVTQGGSALLHFSRCAAMSPVLNRGPCCGTLLLAWLVHRWAQVNQGNYVPLLDSRGIYFEKFSLGIRTRGDAQLFRLTREDGSHRRSVSALDAPDSCRRRAVQSARRHDLREVGMAGVIIPGLADVRSETTLIPVNPDVGPRNPPSDESAPFPCQTQTADPWMRTGVHLLKAPSIENGGW
jgi:hypothetical protein